MLIFSFTTDAANLILQVAKLSSSLFCPKYLNGYYKYDRCVQSNTPVLFMLLAMMHIHFFRVTDLGSGGCKNCPLNWKKLKKYPQMFFVKNFSQEKSTAFPGVQNSVEKEVWIFYFEMRHSVFYDPDIKILEMLDPDAYLYNECGSAVLHIKFILLCHASPLRATTFPISCIQ